MENNPPLRRVVQTAPANLLNRLSSPKPLQLGKHYPPLFLIFALSVGIADLARFIGEEK
jgi:hypothetical protein